jgi:4-aminobutyrate aminotransferase-like enzyme
VKSLTNPIWHANEPISNLERIKLLNSETKCLRTFTPTQTVIAKSAGSFLWTPEGRRLADFTSGVLVANLGHNPCRWMRRFFDLMGWADFSRQAPGSACKPECSIHCSGAFKAIPMTAYNAITPVEVIASKLLLEACSSRPGGIKLERVLWAASGSEAVVKALWAALARDRSRDNILASRHGFHGKKGLAGAVTGSEKDRDRDPRVHFFSFPMLECNDISFRNKSFDCTPYRLELENLWNQHGRKLTALITEPYLGGGGSYHPPASYLKMVQEFCREHDIVFILDEVQSNFGRTGDLFAFETYGLEPDLVVLGKGLGNGMPVAAVVGRTDILESMDYGEGSDTWSANPLASAAVVATLEEFAQANPLNLMKKASTVIENGLCSLRDLCPFIANVRGENGGMVWGIEMADHSGLKANEWANLFVLECYLGEGNEGIHLLGPLAQKVVRISPPLVISPEESQECMSMMLRIGKRMAFQKELRSSGQ